MIGGALVVAFGLGVWQEAAEVYGAAQADDFLILVTLGIVLFGLGAVGLVAGLLGLAD